MLASSAGRIVFFLPGPKKSQLKGSGSRTVYVCVYTNDLYIPFEHVMFIYIYFLVFTP